MHGTVSGKDIAPSGFVAAFVIRDRARSRPAIFVALVWLIAFLCGQAVCRAETAVTVIGMSGTVQVERAGKVTWGAVGIRSTLHAGDRVRTGPNSRGRLVWSDGSSTWLNAGTMVRINPPAAEQSGKSLLEVLVGEARARFSPTGSSRSVQTPTAVIAVRGTDLDVQVADDGTSSLFVVEGLVGFSNRYGAVLVHTGQGSVARPGQAPTAPTTVNVPLIIEWTLDLESMLPPFETNLAAGDRAAKTQDARTLEGQLRGQPGNPAFLLRLADLQHDLGNYTAALDLFNRARQAGVDATTVGLGIAQTELDSGDPTTAARDFADVSARAPAGSNERRAAMRGLALADLALGNQDKAAADAQLLAAEPGGAAVGHTILGRIAVRRGAMDEAITEDQAAIQADPKSGEALVDLAGVQMDRGQSDLALENARHAVAVAPESSRTHAVLSELLFYTGDLREARREAMEAVSINPFSAQAQVALGQAELAGGHPDAAVQAALRAVALDAHSPRIHYFAGLCLAEVRRYDESISELKQALQLYPDFVSANAAMARVYLLQARNDDALALLQDAVKRHPDSAELWSGLAAAHRQLGHLDIAIQDLTNAERLRPGSAETEAELAQALADANRLPDALIHAQRAVALAPNAGHYYAILGLVYDRMQSGAPASFSTTTQVTSEQAQRAYREAIGLYPDESMARLNLAFGQLSDSDQPNPDLYFSEITQGLLRDPSVMREIYRPGISTAVIPEVGTDTDSGSVFNRETADTGKLQMVTFLNATHTDGALPNNGSNSGVLTGYYAFGADPRTNILASVRLEGIDAGQPGTVFQPTPDAELKEAFGQFLLGARREFLPGESIWLAVRHRRIHLNGDDDQAATDGTLGFSSRLRDALTGAEFRWDGHLADPFTLSAGGSIEAETVGFDEGFWDQPQQQPDIFSTRFSQNRALGWTEVQLTPQPWVSLTAGYRYQQLLAGPSTGQIGRAGETTDVPLVRLSATGNLPYAMVTLRPAQATQVRLIALQSQEVGIAPSLAPEEVFEIAEAPSLSLFGRASTLEADVEQQFSPRTFLRVFGYTTRAEQLPIQPDIVYSNVFPGFIIPVARLRGVGVRYEQQITPLLAGYVRWLLNDSIDQSSAEASGKALPMQPSQQLSAGFNFVNRAGYKVRLNGMYRGPMYQDQYWFGDPNFDPTAARPHSGGVWLADLRIAREANLRGEISLDLTNLLDRRYSLWPGVPAPGRGVRLQYEWRM